MTRMTFRQWNLISVMALLLLAGGLVIGCGGSSDGGSGPPTGNNQPTNLDSRLNGTWALISEAFYYDAGGGGAGPALSGTQLQLSPDGTWQFGGSTGSWSVAAITNGDWTAWNVASYGPEKKLVLDNWNQDISTGPIEETDGTVHFVWVIYHAVVSGEGGTVWLKFGR